MLLRIIENCKKVKFIITIDFDSLFVARGSIFKKIFEFIEKLFIDKKILEKFKNSFIILITKEKKNISIDKIKNVFLQSKDEISKILIDRLFFYEPLNQNKRNEFITKIKNMPFIIEENLKVPFNKEEKNYLNKIFQYYTFEMKLNFEFLQNKELKENYKQIRIFQNTKNNYLNININDKIECHFESYFNELQTIFTKLLDLKRFDCCKDIFNHLNYFFDKNEKFKYKLDQLNKSLEKKKEYINLSEKETGVIKEKKEIENDEKANKNIKNLRKEFNINKLKETKKFNDFSKKIENDIKICREKQNYQKLLKFANYLENRKLKTQKLIKEMTQNFENKIEKIKNPENSSSLLNSISKFFCKCYCFRYIINKLF